ncbi:hypothetical protein RM549_02270 [Salegentibacter sp. F188]|uniref:Uncharacterized protein n=1 Tax=Autumnicola patrickiae TaxID=3075591 RepID=A0ABU3DY05_9FLAO|nr:hypothetical protein [Salegentibacter sp. F188]MDT0688590.1 hypothetical protein [Salegentibacter sp. F188]
MKHSSHMMVIPHNRLLRFVSLRSQCRWDHDCSRHCEADRPTQSIKMYSKRDGNFFTTDCFAPLHSARNASGNIIGTTIAKESQKATEAIS